MTRVISISTDRNIFKEGSAVQARQIEYGALFDELHIVVFTKLSSYLPTKLQIAPNVWVYGTHSLSKLLYIGHAVKIASRIIVDRKLSLENTVVSVQDPFETGLVGTKLNKKFKLPLHVQIHTDFLSPYFRKESLSNRFRVKMALKILAKADAVRVVSRKIAESLSRVKLKKDVVPFVLPIYVDIQKFENAPITVDLKKKYPQFNFIILMASRLTKEKNISFALTVFQKILKAYSRTGLVIVGFGPEEKDLKKQVKKLGIEKNVVFEPWQNDLTSYYKTANLFLLTSNYEGYGLTLVEAIASHCPAVSTDVGIAKEILKDGISFVCPVGDSNCFVENISKLIEDISLRERFVHEADNRLAEVTTESNQAYLEQYKNNISSALRG